MPHTLNYNPETLIIEIVVQGAVTLDEFKEIFAQGTQIAKEKECFLFLNDFREATEINLSTIQIYDLPETLSGIAAPSGIIASRFKRALVITPKIAADSSFAEDVAINRGQNDGLCGPTRHRSAMSSFHDTTRLVGVCAFSGSLRGLKLIPLKWRCLVPPTSG